MKKLMLLLIIPWLLLPNVGLGRCKITDEFDEFKGIRKIYQEKNKANGYAKTLHLNLIYFPDDGLLAMLGAYYADSWIFVETQEEGIIFLTDTGTVKLSTVKGSSSVMGGGKIIEGFVINITPEQVERLVSATDLKCRLYGKRGYVEFKKLKKVQKCWGEYMKLYRDSFSGL